MGPGTSRKFSRTSDPARHRLREPLERILKLCPRKHPLSTESAQRSQQKTPTKPAKPDITAACGAVSGRGYWGSNPYVPASLRSPDPARASARQAQFSGLPPTSGNCKRRLSRRSPRSGRSRTSPQSNAERLSRRSYEAAKADHSPESATRRRVQAKRICVLISADSRFPAQFLLARCMRYP